MSVTEEVIETMAGCRMALMSPSGSAESHAHPYRQTVKAVHQANSKRQIANLFRAKMVEQRQINVIFGMGAGYMGDGFGPRQCRTLLLAEVMTHPPACQSVQFGLRNTGFAQRLTVHFQQKAQPLICETRR